jgi:peroxiredoxin
MPSRANLGSMRMFLLRWVCALVVCAGLLQAGALSNRRAPSFTLYDASFNTHDLLDYRGKVVIIDFMQTACPHCATFSGILEKVKAKYGDRVVILSIVNPPSTQADVKNYAAKNKVTTPILMDCGQMAFSYLKPSPQNPGINVPHVFIIDRKGMIVDDYGYGPLTKGIFEGKDFFPIIDKVVATK